MNPRPLGYESGGRRPRRPGEARRVHVVQHPLCAGSRGISRRLAPLSLSTGSLLHTLLHPKPPSALASRPERRSPRRTVSAAPRIRDERTHSSAPTPSPEKGLTGTAEKPLPARLRRRFTDCSWLHPHIPSDLRKRGPGDVRCDDAVIYMSLPAGSWPPCRTDSVHATCLTRPDGTAPPDAADTTQNHRDDMPTTPRHRAMYS